MRRDPGVEQAAAAPAGPLTAPPLTAPPLTAPPLTAPPLTAPPLTAPPLTAPPLTAGLLTAGPCRTRPENPHRNADIRGGQGRRRSFPVVRRPSRSSCARRASGSG
ncbi:hypothetical protein E1288_31035 [Saccharopolyspora elongata]|uniref:Uncharacterized protein n=1 Tax=Saccharopolyspora elongata TaxID=2530387 RepID=A0A4R4YBE9_9PSEU|nr:hypothetical protein E1288_31035 [Saccharopolyspora elongata]